MSRTAIFNRETTETQIRGALSIDGSGRYDVRTGIRFFDHMLELFTRHGGFDLTLKATGDLDVDQHHTVEDVGIVLGESLLKALGDRKGINRAGYFVMPMDETLAVVAVDLSGRPHAVVDLKVKARMVGDLQSELVHDFFDGFAPDCAAPDDVDRQLGDPAEGSLKEALTFATTNACSARPLTPQGRATTQVRAPRAIGWQSLVNAY